MRMLIEMGEAAEPMLRAKLQDKGLELEVVVRIQKILASADPVEGILSGRYKELGWASGFANSGDPEKVSYFRLFGAKRVAEGVAVNFDWQNGSMELRLHGRTLSGRYRQDNATGHIEFTFDARGEFVSGRWDDDTCDGHWEKAFMR